jgi:hypothetical protein
LKPLDEAQRKVIADRLREFSPWLDEPAIARAIFALSPVRPAGEVCALCGFDLSTRPVLTTTINPAFSRKISEEVDREFARDLENRFARVDREVGERASARARSPAAGDPPTTIAKRVRMKPRQVVISARVEGSHGPPLDVPEALFRFCAKCVDLAKP